MTNNGQLFITENVRDEIMSNNRDVFNSLRENNVQTRVEEHPHSPSFSDKVDPINYPERGKVVIRDDDTDEILGEAAFTVNREVERGMGGNRLRAFVTTPVVAWRSDRLAERLPNYDSVE